MLLALDTSTSNASIALVDEHGALVAELSWHVGQRHSVELAQRLRWLMDAYTIASDQFSLIAVARGPGSFNGVRVAVTTAKALAWAQSLPLVGVVTLDVIAWGAVGGGMLCDTASSVWALLEAGRGQLYAARYPSDVAPSVVWAPQGDYALLTPQQLVETITAGSDSAAPALLCGELRAATRSALEARLGSRARLQPPLRGRRAVWLAELALARAAREAYDDVAAIEPLYVRRPAITTSTRHHLNTTALESAESAESAEHAGQQDDMSGGEGALRALRG